MATIGRDTAPYRLFLRLFWIWSERERLLRLGRLVYRGGEGPGTASGGYSAKLSLALRPRLLAWRFDRDDKEVTLLGVRFHHLKSFGGWIT